MAIKTGYFQKLLRYTNDKAEIKLLNHLIKESKENDDSDRLKAISDKTNELINKL